EPHVAEERHETLGEEARGDRGDRDEAVVEDERHVVPGGERRRKLAAERAAVDDERPGGERGEVVERRGGGAAAGGDRRSASRTAVAGVVDGQDTGAQGVEEGEGRDLVAQISDRAGEEEEGAAPRLAGYPPAPDGGATRRDLDLGEREPHVDRRA